MEAKLIATNKVAQRDYHIIETYEAGVGLKGTEVKSLREGNANLRDSFARIEPEGIFLYNMHISPYIFGNIANVEPKRKRALLLHKSQVRKLLGKISQRGFTLVPLKIYFNERGKAKIELGLVKGKRLYDKRQAIKKREAKREVQRALRHKNK
ncbi:MAG: SsrA-binding protein SmpB [Candidatus Omnitrophica bacterium]|nr:SsrA-binding protein SmpB [Candidatus Omnitrophota bacterium]